MVQGIILKDGTVLIAQIEEIIVDLGEPNCKLIDPYVYTEDDETYVRWNIKYTDQTQFMLNSDSILTIFTPREEDIKNYIELNQIENTELSSEEQ